ncbi:MAG: alkaline phosphatase family protein [Myxococcales bacterium]|nr:alkaline phosphatase family protein [Myxococcales bacterium]
MNKLPRRRILQGIGATAGLAACGDGPSSSSTTTSVVEPGSIDTIVMLMMENRSFDHVFGSLSLVEGRTDVDGLRPDLFNAAIDGTPVYPTQLVDPCTEPDPPHGWNTSREQLDGGSCGGFVRAYQNDNKGEDFDLSQVMAYQTRSMQPISYALADAYALCERWFSSVLSSTWPNRIYWHAGTSQGIRTNDLPKGRPYSATTIWDQLQEAGVDWSYYFTDLPTLGLWNTANWQGRLKRIDNFYAEVEAGILPPVVCVDAAASFNDDHPPHHPLLGQLFIASIYEALARSRYWDRCLFIVTYDEAGGFYDHVPPPLTDDDHADLGFDQLGFRVPAFVAGPYVRNVVSNVQFDHTAAIRFIQSQYDLPPLTARNAASNDLGELLDTEALAMGTPKAPIVLPTIERSEEEIAAECDKAGERSGQPELRDVLARLAPHLDHTDQMKETAWGLWTRFGEQGLWVPR